MEVPYNGQPNRPGSSTPPKSPSISSNELLNCCGRRCCRKKKYQVTFALNSPRYFLIREKVFQSSFKRILNMVDSLLLFLYPFHVSRSDKGWVFMSFHSCFRVMVGPRSQGVLHAVGLEMPIAHRIFKLIYHQLYRWAKYKKSPEKLYQERRPFLPKIFMIVMSLKW